MEWRAQAEKSPHIDNPELRIVRINEDRMSIVTNIDFKVYPRDSFVPKTDIDAPIIGPDAVGFMQAVMDAAWEYGLRPSEMQDEKHLKAHLEDMRSITRHVLKMDR